MKGTKRSKNIERMIVEATKQGLSLFAWKASSHETIEKCEMKIKALRRDYNELELTPTDEYMTEVNKIITGNRILNIYIPDLSISFSSELKSVGDDKSIKIMLPSEYLFYERRKHERIRPTKSCYIEFDYNKQHFKRSLFDLSLGGFAMVLPKSDKITIIKGRTVKFFTVTIDDIKIRVTAECVSSFLVDRFKIENLPYGGYKLAFRFLEISRSDRIYLADYITNEVLKNQIEYKVI